MTTPAKKKAAAKKTTSAKKPVTVKQTNHGPTKTAPKKTPTKKASAKKPAAATLRAVAESVNLDPMDVNADLYIDRPLIAEKDLEITVSELCKVHNFEAAAMAIEIAVRRAYHLEGAA